MQVILEKLNLTDFLTIELEIDKNEFTRKFQEKIEPDRGYFADELFSSKKEYLGEIKSDKFEVRVKRRFLNFNIQTSIAKGEILEKNGKTKLEIDIVGCDSFSTLGIIIAPVFFLILLIKIIVVEAYPALLLFIPIAIFMLTLPYSIMKKNMKKFKIKLKENLKFK